MKKVFVFLIVFLISFFYFSITTATNPSDVVINEIAWMGTTASANDEWIELYNNTTNQIDLSAWTLQTADEKIKIPLTGIIPANSFYLLERTDDSTVLNITADLIYKGALSNSGEDLWLYDGNNNLIDEANFSIGWDFGDNTTKQTIEKTSTGWQTSKDAGGTPKSQNSTGAIVKTVPAEDSPPRIYPAGVILNEILPSPEGADDQNEWIELYNTNNFDVDLSGWKIKDIEGATTNYFLLENTKISAYGYLILKRPDTKITLNNTTDGLTLFWPNEKIIDSMAYEKAPINQSYNRMGANWQWSASPTPGAKNIESLSKIEKSGNSKEVDQNLAAISQSINQEEIKNTNPWFLFLVALAITIFSAIIVLFIKFKFQKHVRT